MIEYYTVESAFALLGFRDAQGLRYYLDLHKPSHDAELVDRRGKPKRIYKIETLQNMMEVHKQDVVRRGNKRGMAPAGFSYTKLDGNE